MQVFNIISIQRESLSTVCVGVAIDAKAWRLAKSKAHLGLLYGVDISNQVYRSFGVKAYNPSVNDKQNASKGIKTVSLRYNDTTWIK